MSSDPDRTVERLLKRSRRTEVAPVANAPCLDAETLAAWVDGGLSAKQSALAEGHLAQCQRCQAMAATIARSAPPAPMAEPWWQRRWALGWLVPLTAGAAAVVLWIAVPREQPAAPQPETAAVERSQSGAASDDQRSAAQARDEERQRFESPGKPSLKAAPAEADGREARAQPVPPRSDALDRFADAAGGAPASPAPAATAPAAAAMSNRTSASEQTAASPGIESADPTVRWRLGVPGVVQRSTDRGASWEDLPTGVATDLTAGAAPSTLVCWIVGRQGTVLRTTDGRLWQRIVFPEAIDLVGVTATDARSAAVTAADGRTFRTVDGGNSWLPSPLQEF
jgi:hypothetical protein